MKRFELMVASSLGLLAMASCTESYYTAADFYTTPKVDVHTHLHGPGLAIAEQAAKDNFRLVTIALDEPGDVPAEQQFTFGLMQAEKFPDRIENITAFSLANWQQPNWVQKVIDQLKNDFARGAIGVKIWKSIGMTYKDSAGNFIMIDHPRFDSIFRFIIESGKLVVGHLGEPRNCWLPLEQMTVISDRNYFERHPQYHMFLHPEFPSYEKQVEARDRLLEKHPDLNFVGAHLGSLEWEVDELAKRLDKFPNMTVDLTERICHWQHQSVKDYDKVRNFVIRYQDRLLYGTDIYIVPESDAEETQKKVHKIWADDWQYFTTADSMQTWQVEGRFKGLHLPKQVVNKIFYQNAVRVFQLSSN